MDFANYNDVVREENPQSTPVVVDDFETTCWGCGLRVVVASYASVFKCGWCGAITKQNVVKNDNHKYLKWRRLRDKCFVCIVILFMLFFICGGIWAVYPIVFSISYTCGTVHLVLALILSVSTLSSFCLSAFKPAGSPPLMLWGSYPTVHKGGLENHTFCHYCSKPKSPRTHHCSSCGTCVLDMDHHCPFIGNCVGSANHRSFILFLISTVMSTIYVAVMTSYCALYIWPPLEHARPITLSNGVESIFVLSKEYVLAILRAAVFLPVRGLVLVYLFVASVSVGIGLSVLLWQQLWYIYSGKTYLSHLSSGGRDIDVEKDCEHLVRFFGVPLSAASYLPSYRKSSRKRHDK